MSVHLVALIPTLKNDVFAFDHMTFIVSKTFLKEILTKLHAFMQKLHFHPCVSLFLKYIEIRFYRKVSLQKKSSRLMFVLISSKSLWVHDRNTSMRRF